MVTAMWAEDESASVASVEELRGLLERLDGERVDGARLMVGLEAPKGSLAVGLGYPDSSVLEYVPDGDEDISYVSLGSASESEPTAGFFTMLGAYSEFSPASAVPKHAALAAAEAFFESGGEMPAGIDWVRDS